MLVSVVGGRFPGGSVGGKQLLHRQAELDTIEDWIGQVTEGYGGGLLLRGPRGIGRTELVGATAELAESALVLRAQGSVEERDLPLGVLGQLLGDWEYLVRAPLGGTGPCTGTGPLTGTGGFIETETYGSAGRRAGTGDSVGTGDAADADGAGSAFGPVPATTTPPGPGTTTGPITTGAARQAELTGMVAAIHREAARRPVLLLVDDAADADPESLQALGFLLRRSVGRAVGLLLAIRADGAGSTDPEPALESMLAIGRWIELIPDPLCAGCATSLATAILGGPVDEDLLDAINLLAAGTPGVVVALAKALAAAGVQPAAPDPDQVVRVAAEVLGRTRLGWLSAAHPPAGDLLAAMAVTGDQDPALPAMVLGLGELAAARARSVLHDAGLITAGSHGKFTRELIRTVVLGGVSLPKRTDLHLAAAELLSRLGGRVREVAEHLMSVPPTGAPWAAAALEAAAQSAADDGDYGAASRYLQRAVVESAGTGPAGVLVGQIGKVEAHRDLGAAARQVEALVAAEPDARVRARLLVPVLDCALAADAEPLSMHLITGAQLTAPDPTCTDALLLAAAAAVNGEPAALRPVWRTVLGPGLSPAVTAAAAGVRGAAAAVLAGAGRSRTAVNAGVRAGMAGADRIAPLLAAMWAEDLDTAIGGATALAELATENPARQIAALALRAEANRRSGRVPAALADAQAAHDLAVELRARGLGNAAAAVLVLALTDADQHDLARQALTRVDPLARPHPLIAGLVRYAAGVQGMHRSPERALGYLAEAGRLLAGAGLDNPACLGWQFAAVSAHLATGRREVAQELAEQTLQRAQRWGTPGLRGQALAAQAMCRPDGGLRLLHQAAELLAESPLRGELRRVLASTVALAQAGGDDRAAVRAADQAARLGATPDRTPATDEHPRLTASESRVTDLVTQGMSNQEVADTLCLSRRTVDTHLGRIYRKLGIRSRTELADALRPLAPDQQ